ncbi:M13 family metallopeptidase [Dellaglioa sp. P0083]|uniref:M13 family metallopeptidase n=1 Tax=Dellaglioa kimchii TaxID=3344667 RepID=UPI0038D3EE75
MTINKQLIKDDLYEAVNGEWLKTAKIPDDKPATGGFNDLADEIDKTLMADFEKMSADSNVKAPLMQEFLNYYDLAADFDRRESEGTLPLKKVLAPLENLTSLADFDNKWADFVRAGYPTPLGFDVDADMKNAKMNALFVAAPSLVLPDKTYYERDNSQAEGLLKAFRAMMTKLLVALDYSEENANHVITEALTFDRNLVPHVKSAEESADYSKAYNPQSFTEFSSQSSNLDLKSIVRNLLNGNEPEKIIVTEPKFLAAIDELVNTTHFTEFKSWLIVKTVGSLSSYLSDDLRVIAGEYGRALSGSKAPKKQQKFAYYLAMGTYSGIVGEYYGHKYFGEDAKADVQQMVEKMINVYQNRLATNSWLTSATRDKAILKLSKLGIQVGYPDKINPLYQKMHVNMEKTLLENAMAFDKLATEDMFSKWDKPVDRDLWEMSAATVNAYYHPFKNIIVFPAAILQAPFYSLEQSSSSNYGGIGAVIAHEISHAFDNNGALFDEYGNLNNWWSEADLAHFKELSQQMITEFDGTEFAGQKVNGTLTVSENIADAGGLSCALEAAKSEDDADFEAFFINWAQVWRMKASTQYMQLLLSIDVHAPAKLRANIQVQNLTEFYDAFDIVAGDAMYKAADKRVNIW